MQQAFVPLLAQSEPELGLLVGPSMGSLNPAILGEESIAVLLPGFTLTRVESVNLVGTMEDWNRVQVTPPRPKTAAVGGISCSTNWTLLAGPEEQLISITHS